MAKLNPSITHHTVNDVEMRTIGREGRSRKAEAKRRSLEMKYPIRVE
jgi:hypothetical protein